MKMYVRVILSVLCALMIAALPFAIPSATTPGDIFAEMQEEEWEDEEYEDEYEEDSASLFDLFLPRACAEEEEIQEETIEGLVDLPIDFSAGMTPNPAGYTENSYEDPSISVQMETREEGDVTYCIAWVKIATPAQLRTGIAGKKVSSKNVAKISTLAKRYNAIVAINADFMTNNPSKTSFEYRMGQEVRKKRNANKDVLIIDEKGDFHLYVSFDEDTMKQAMSEGYSIINAFTFGPALVIDGQVQDLRSNHEKYDYNPTGQEPRMAIGQTGELSYVLVMAEGRNKNSDGATQQEMADFCASLGCIQAFNLDGGNSAEMVFNNAFYGSRKGNERDQSDIIYFCSAIDPVTWQ